MTACVKFPIAEYIDAGLSVIPVSSRNKRPLGPWKHYQTRKPDIDEIGRWSNGGFDSMAVVCGNASDRLEIIDIDDNSTAGYTADDFWYPLRDAIGHIIEQYNFPLWRTGGNGYQLAYRCETIDGNLKLAWVPDDTQPHGRSITIETRARVAMRSYRHRCTRQASAI
ncbi:MAG: bifunctional DNA primase/polymerase [Caldilineaceae bacterium]